MSWCRAKDAKGRRLEHPPLLPLFNAIGGPEGPQRAWSPQRAKIGGGEAFVEKYSGAAPWATPEFIRELIGPNFGETVGASGEALSVYLGESGQIIWQEMQLTERQLRAEMKRFAVTHPGLPLQVNRSPGSTEDLLRRIEAIAQALQIELQLPP